MKAVLVCATLLVASLVYTNESQAGNFYGGGVYSGLPFNGFGYGFGQNGTGLYGLGYVPVPPYFALHPPVYYSHEIRRRPIGDSPYAYLPRRPVPQPKRQFSLNPFVPHTIIEGDSQQTSETTDSVATVMKNPFYGDSREQLAESKLIYNPFYAKPEAVIAQASD